MELPAAHGAVADDAAGYFGFFAHLVGQRDAQDRGHVRAFHGVVAEVADRRVGAVQAAALPAGDARGAAKELCHDPLAVALMFLLRQRVDAMAAMVGEETVGRPELRRQRGLGRLLPDAGVQHPRHIALLELALQAKFKGPDEPHVAVQVH